MKILNVNPYIDSVTGGGTAERTVQMSRFQSKQGHEVTILTLDIGIDSGLPSSLSTVNVIVLPLIIKRFLVPNISLRRLRKLVASIDVIHLMGHWTLLNVVIHKLARQLGVPYVICPAGALPIFGRSYLLKHVYNFIWGKKILLNADHCISVTEKEIVDFEAYGVDRKKICVIPNGVDIDAIPKPCAEKWGQLELPNKPFILFLGRLNVIKGPDLLLQAYSACSAKFDLVFVGPDGGMLKELKQYSQKTNLNDKVHFIGPLYGDDKFQAYYAASALVVPSRKEAMSIVAIESGIVGTPVLLTNQCGFDEVQEIRGGIVVEASIDGLKNGLIGLVRREGELVEMGERLKRFTHSCFAWSEVVKKYDTLYERIQNQCV